MRNVSQLQACAERHLADYTDPEGPRAFATYDWQGDPERLTPTDLFAPALLDAAIRKNHILAMFRPTGPYRDLLVAMQAVLDNRNARTARFEDQDFDAHSGAWSLVNVALRASKHTPDVKASKVTKALHRKRPALVPIFDSRMADFYGTGRFSPWRLWSPLRDDLVANQGWLAVLAVEHPTPDGRPLTTLRALDIIVWEHSRGCIG